MKRALFLGAASLVVACGGEPLAPIPRFSLSPAYVCEGAEPQTVGLDASDSLASDGGEPVGLAYAWTLLPAPVEVLTGDWTTDRLVVKVATWRATRVHLVLSAPDGASAEAWRTIGLTLGQRRPCVDGCAAEETCAVIEGAPICVQDRTCADDDACAPCGVCRLDAGGHGRCVSR